MIALVGSTGMIGRTLQSQTQFDQVFHSKNIDDILKHQFAKIIVAAPSSNRRWVQANNDQDTQNVQKLLDVLSRSQTQQIILLSTLDAIVLPDTKYGQNRKWLADSVLDLDTNNKVVYIGAPIGPFVNKGLLYDLKHRQFIDQIDCFSSLQYSPLDNLWQFINFAAEDSRNVFNFCSEPINTESILDLFYPDIPKSSTGQPIKYNVPNVEITKIVALEKIKQYCKGIVV